MLSFIKDGRQHRSTRRCDKDVTRQQNKKFFNVFEVLFTSLGMAGNAFSSDLETKNMQNFLLAPTMVAPEFGPKISEL